MCKVTETYIKILDWIDRKPTTFMMLAGFVFGSIAVYFIGGLYDKNNKLLIDCMEKQSIAQIETAQAIKELSLRHAETNTRLSSLEYEIRRSKP